MGVSLDDYLEGGDRSGPEIEPDAPTPSSDDDFDIEEFSIGDWVEITRGYTDPDTEDEVCGLVGQVESIDKDDDDYPLLIDCKGDMHWVYRAVLIDPPEQSEDDEDGDEDEDDDEDRPTTGDLIVVTELAGVVATVPLPQVVKIEADDHDGNPYLCKFIIEGDEHESYYVMEGNCYRYTGDRTDVPFLLEDEKSWSKKREDLWQAVDEARVRLNMHLSANLRPDEVPCFLVRQHGLIEGKGRRIDAIKDLRFVWSQRMGPLSLADAKGMIEDAIRTVQTEKERE